MKISFKRIRLVRIVLAGVLIIGLMGDWHLLASEENFLRRGQTTVIEADKQYNAYVDSAEKAAMAIREYGRRQRELYENPEVEALELQMEQDYGILSVNLGEISPETAKEIEAGFAYMYQKYPILQHTLTNLSLANFPVNRGSELAITQSREFMVNEMAGNCPFVVKYEIWLNAVKFLNPDKMKADYANQIETGHWPEGTNTSSVIVHELAHHLMDVLIMEKYGLYDGAEFAGYYITEENQDAFGDCITDSLSRNQWTLKAVVKQGYERWLKEYGQTGSEEAFRGSISEYALGIQPDGGISYGETIAEAFADVYLNGDEAALASQAIVSCVGDGV